MTKEQKILRYHTEELMLILFICSTDLSKYDDEELVIFAESIEGVIEGLFEQTFLLKIADRFPINQVSLQYFNDLKVYITSLYSSRWSQKMKDISIWSKCCELSNKLLIELNLQWVEPREFIQNNLVVDWT